MEEEEKEEVKVGMWDEEVRLEEGGRRLTFARLVMDADGLRLVVAVVVLDAHQMGVGAVVEARAHGQHVFVGLVHGLHQLARTEGDEGGMNSPVPRGGWGVGGGGGEGMT